MTTAETIYEKLIHLPPKAHEEILDAVERIELRYGSVDRAEENGNVEKVLLDLLAEIQIEGPPDLAERHDYYAHGKLEN